METNEARRLLDEERERLEVDRERLRTDDEGSDGELSDVDQHPADEGTDTYNREADAALLDSVEQQLAEVSAALERLDEGTYGQCAVCGRPIPDERLAALPTTRYDVEHQAQAEAEGAAADARTVE